MNRLVRWLTALLLFTAVSGQTQEVGYPPAPAAPAARADCRLPVADEDGSPAEATVRRAVVPAGRQGPVALALGSGSMHGYAHIGIIEELEARGVPVEIVTGTSVGALIGSLWASGLSGQEIEQASHDKQWDTLGQFSFSGEGLLDNRRLKAELEPLFKGRPIEAWPRRFAAVVTDLRTGRRRLLTRGDGALAVQASTAVPVLFRPVHLDGAALADGALVEPIPVRAARNLGAGIVIAVDVAYRPYEEEASGVTGIAFQTMHIMVNAMAADLMREADVPIRLDLHHRFKTCGREALVAAGREAVRRAWPQIEAALAAGPPAAMR